MILIAGKYKGRKLKTPKSDVTRPTTSLVRKALFDICQAYIEESQFLDLFAGSGAIGLEALSRGASHVTFIEQGREALHCLAHNIQELRCERETKILRGNSLLILKKLKTPFNIIYIDPPYGKIPLTEILQIIDEGKMVAPEGHIFIETLTTTSEQLEDIQWNHLRFKDVRRFGKTLLYHFIASHELSFSNDMPRHSF